VHSLKGYALQQALLDGFLKSVVKRCTNFSEDISIAKVVSEAGDNRMCVSKFVDYKKGEEWSIEQKFCCSFLK